MLQLEQELYFLEKSHVVTFEDYIKGKLVSSYLWFAALFEMNAVKLPFLLKYWCCLLCGSFIWNCLDSFYLKSPVGMFPYNYYTVYVFDKILFLLLQWTEKNNFFSTSLRMQQNSCYFPGVKEPQRPTKLPFNWPHNPECRRVFLKEHNVNCKKASKCFSACKI